MFSFVTSSGSQLVDGVRVVLTVQNQGEQPLQVGVRQLWDTYLAESATTHFTADGQRPITRETELTGASRPAFWSSVRPADSAGLYVLTTGEGIDTPERIVFANWKRLNDSSWSFQTSASRTFSNLPYSVNDSAVAEYYGPRAVAAGATLTVGTVLGASTVGSFIPKTAQVAAGAPMSSSEILTAIASTGGIADPLLAANTDLGVLNDLIKTIESRIPDAAKLTEADLRALADALRELGARIGQYVGTQSTASP